MLTHTLSKLETKIKASPNIPDDKKDEYLSLLTELNTQINLLSNDDREKAKSIAGFTEVSTQQAVREEINPDLLKISADGLAESAREIGASYPKLTSLANDICNLLSRLGI
ncbi:MAG: hypothetical protein GXP53_11600 [Deltaproteobacteria bacterium]|nr:hypothetical protein [Deltaproteobacteria bacterium]